MTDATVSVETSSADDDSLVIHPRGVLGTDEAGELRRALVHVLRHLRPHRLILDLNDVEDLDPINLGTLAAACHLGDDHQVVVYLDNTSTAIADRLTAAGVARHHLR